MTGGPAGAPPACGWAGQAHWTVLQSDFGHGADFLAAWRAWRDDARRPRLLHFVAIAPDPPPAEELARHAQAHQGLGALGHELAAQWFGLAPGLHRLAFESGRVLLTVAVDEALPALQALELRADALLLGQAGVHAPADPRLLAAFTRMCRRGAQVAAWHPTDDARRVLAQHGVEWQAGDGAPSRGAQRVRGRFMPRWTLRDEGPGPVAPSDCVVIGAGLAGAAAAASLARRGWRVRVLDAAPRPAAGASALPAGLMAAYASADDNLLSRLTRCGIRITLQQAADLLIEGQDWAPCGVLERSATGAPMPAPAGPGLGAWSAPAGESQKQAARIGAEAAAWWHERSAWVRPAALVEAWLAQPGISFRGGCPAGAIEAAGGGWRVRDPQGGAVAEAPLVVIAAALGSAAWLPGSAALRPVRGQVSYGALAPGEAPEAPFPLNGNGHFLPDVHLAGSRAWLAGSSYQRDDADAAPRPGDRQDNLRRLRQLLPAAAAALESRFETGQVADWSGIRCVARDRRPLLGEIGAGLWVSAAMGSRGLSFAALCGELLAARLHGEPLPLARRLAKALDPARLDAGHRVGRS